MRTVSVREIQQTVRTLCMEANRQLTPDMEKAVRQAQAAETQPLPRQIMGDLVCNLEAADETGLPICQDTGMAVVFLQVGQEVALIDGDLTEAVNRGVAAGYTDGYLRCSVVADPLRRGNTGDNTPAVLHTEIVPGDRVSVTVAPKGFGSENMSRLYMLTPAADRETVLDKICETARLAGSNACPPMVLGVGLGGDFELCALLAKKALCRPLDVPHPDPYYAELEKEALKRVNALGVGPQGFGGVTTALGVQIETYPTHIAGLPLAINVGCHVTRHRTAVL